MSTYRQFKQISTVGELKEFLKDAPDSSAVFANSFMYGLLVRYLVGADGKPMLDIRIRKGFNKNAGN